MSNPFKRESSPSKNNPYQDYFKTPGNEKELENQMMLSSSNFSTEKNQDNSFGEKISRDTLLDIKINQLNENKFSRKDKRRNSLFPSSKNIKQNLEESLKDIGVIKKGNEDHLTIRKLPEINEEEYYKIQNENIDQDTFNKLYEQLNKVNCNFKSYFSPSVGGILPLTYLIETFYESKKEKKNEMNDKYNLLKSYIYNYRTINGDGNCFYRAAMFRFLEILILNKKIKILQKIVYDLVKSFNSEELKNRRNILDNDIKPELTFKILFLIVDLLKKDMIFEAHKFLVKSFSLCQKFDYAIIFYFRYILYRYIKANENKIYLKTFPIKIGNLLPNEFESEDGEFLFNKFYNNYLLKFFTDAEKIIIYLTPFVLGIELNIIVFDLNDEISQKFIFEGESEIKTDEIITLLNKKDHYEIVYTKKDIDKFQKYYEIYENNIKPIILIENDDNKLVDSTNTEDDFNLLNSYKKKGINEDDLKEKKNKTQIKSIKKNINDNKDFNNTKSINNNIINLFNKDNNTKCISNGNNNMTNNKQINNNEEENEKNYSNNKLNFQSQNINNNNVNNIYNNDRYNLDNQILNNFNKLNMQNQYINNNLDNNNSNNNNKLNSQEHNYNNNINNNNRMNPEFQNNNKNLNNMNYNNNFGYNNKNEKDNTKLYYNNANNNDYNNNFKMNNNNMNNRNTNNNNMNNNNMNNNNANQNYINKIENNNHIHMNYLKENNFNNKYFNNNNDTNINSRNNYNQINYLNNNNDNFYNSKNNE